jgi:hypothetical protein
MSLLRLPRPAKVPLSQDQAFLDYLLLLRFGSADNPDTAHPILNFTSIAKLVNRPLATV